MKKLAFICLLLTTIGYSREYKYNGEIYIQGQSWDMIPFVVVHQLNKKHFMYEYIQEFLGPEDIDVSPIHKIFEERGCQSDDLSKATAAFYRYWYPDTGNWLIAVCTVVGIKVPFIMSDALSDSPKKVEKLVRVRWIGRYIGKGYGSINLYIQD